MTDREYRQDDQSDGYCPLCAAPLSNLTVAAQGYCERHGWVSADWTPRTASGSEYVKCEVCGKEWDTVSPCAPCNATRSYGGRA